MAASPTGNPHAVNWRQLIASEDLAVNSLGEQMKKLDETVGNPADGELTEAEAAPAIALLGNPKMFEEIGEALKNQPPHMAGGPLFTPVDRWTSKIRNTTNILEQVPAQYRSHLPEIFQHAAGKGYEPMTYRDAPFAPSDAVRVENGILIVKLWKKGSAAELSARIPLEGDPVASFKASFDAQIAKLDRGKIPAVIIDAVMAKKNDTMQNAVELATINVILPSEEYGTILISFTVGNDGKVVDESVSSSVEIDPRFMSPELQAAITKASLAMRAAVRTMSFPAGYLPTPVEYPFYLISE